jgi:CheY-like chemotaxis protein
MSPAQASPQVVLIVSDIASEGALVQSLLEPDFEKVLVAVDGDAATEMFRQSRVTVLVLAHKVLQKAVGFYLGLYRRSTELKIPVHPHRTIALCDRKDVREAFDLCTSGQLSDYVQFWPTTYDAPRLLMAVRGALKSCSDEISLSKSSLALAAQHKRLAQLEELLSQYLSTGAAHLATASLALTKTETDIETALAGLSSQILNGGSVQLRPGQQPDAFSRELSGFSAESILPHLRGASSTLEPLAEWAVKMEKAVTPHIKSTRAQLQKALPVGRTILVVDDDPFQRQMIGRVLESAGYLPLYATNGTDALSMVRKSQPDLILMDVLMPDMSGLECVQRLKNEPALSKIPVVMVTGESVRNVVLESVKLGVADFLVKPIERKSLLGKLARLLGQRIPDAAGVDRAWRGQRVQAPVPVT